MHYTLPRDVFEMLVESFGSKERAEKLARAIEEAIDYAKTTAKEHITDQKETTKLRIKHELKEELLTKELFEERMKVIDERFKRIEFKQNILIALMLIIITFANPTFVELIKQIFK